jgi:hypothetical protein
MKLIFGSHIHKLFAYLLFYAIFSTVIYFFESWIVYNLFSVKEWSQMITFMLHVCYYFLFCILMWKDLYSLNYHYFLKYESRWVILKNLVITSLIIFNMVFLLLFFDFLCGWKQLLEVYLWEIFTVLILDALFIIVAQLFQYFWIRHLVKLGFLQKNVLIVGEPDPRFPIMQFFDDIVSTNIYAGTLFMENGNYIYRNPDGKEEVIPSHDLKELLFRRKISEIIVFINRNLNQTTLLRIVGFCRLYKIGYYLVPDIAKLPRRAFWESDFFYIPIIERFATNRDSLTYVTCKRLFDLIVSCASLFLLVPLALLIGIAIKLEDGGPVFYVHNRVGKNGKIIRFFKFRSMVPGAENLKKDLLKFNARKNGPLFKMKNDPRITRVGKILRRHSLDELPQILNVIRGDMSLIGPRPHLVSEVA